MTGCVAMLGDLHAGVLIERDGASLQRNPSVPSALLCCNRLGPVPGGGEAVPNDCTQLLLFRQRNPESRICFMNKP